MSGRTRQLQIEYRESIPDFLNVTVKEFEHEARMALVVKLFELGKISSGIAAEIVKIPRVRFLMELSRYGVTLMNFNQDELDTDAGLTDCSEK